MLSLLQVFPLDSIAKRADGVRSRRGLLHPLVPHFNHKGMSGIALVPFAAHVKQVPARLFRRPPLIFVDQQLFDLFDAQPLGDTQRLFQRWLGKMSFPSWFMPITS